MQQNIDPSSQILKLIILSQKGQDAAEKKLQIINQIVKITKNVFVSNQDVQQMQKLQTEDYILWARNLLQDNKSQIRANAIKFLKYLITDQRILGIYRQKGVHYFIVRSLQRDCKQPNKPDNNNNNRSQTITQNVHEEIQQALKFTHRWLEKLGGSQNANTGKFPKVLGNALVAMAESCDEQYKRHAIITLREFALNAPELCSWCGGIRILIENAMESSLSDISDQIVWTLLYLLNEPQARTTIRMYLDLSKWFSIFTEIDPPIEQKNEKNRTVNTKFEANLQLAKKAIITVLKSWQGLIYLGDERQALRSLIQVLRQPIKPAIRNSIYDILRSLLSLGNKENAGVSVVNRQQQQDGFIGEYKINNLLNNYLVMLIQVLLDCDLFKILVELSGLPDIDVSGPAQRFLKELSSLMFNLIPDCNKYTDFLIAAANQNDPFLQDLKSWSSEIVNTMGNYAFDNTNKKGRNQISKFLYQCESLYLTTQLGLPTHKINNETVGIIRGQIESKADENKFQTLLKQSNVQDKKEDFSKWNWNYILDLLENYLYDETRYQETIRNRFLKNLLTYYFPSNMKFCDLDWKADYFNQAKCGYLLLKLLLRDKKGREILSQTGGGYLGITKSYIQDLISLLKADNLAVTGVKASIDSSLQKHSAQYLFESEHYSQKMIREYISWIGLFSFSKNGQNFLEQTGIFLILKDYILDSGRRDHVLIHLIHSFDYGKQSKAREFFSWCLEGGSSTLIKACLDFIRLLYRSELHDFNVWAIDLLINSLYKNDEIGLKALSVIEEVTQDIENAKKFLEKVNIQRLLILCQKCESQLIITLLSHKKGFEKIYKELNGYLLNEIERWKVSECEKYIDKVEKVMCEALEFVSSEEQQYLFKFPLLQNSNENPNASIGFVYKMPWSMLLNCELGGEGNGNNIKKNLEYAHLNVTIDYPGTTNQFILIGKSDKFIQFSQNYLFVIKLQICVGKIFVDNQFKEVSEPYMIRCDANDKKNKSVIKDNQLIIEKNGIQFIFDQFDQTIRFNQIRVQVRLGETKNNTIKMPAHIFGELAFTDSGFNLLKNYFDYFVQSIRSSDVSFQQKRSALWAIGHIGQSKNGIKLIKDLGLIQDLVKMAEQYPVLSLRGTCLYTLNLICTTSIGRQELEKFQWISHLNSNSGWLCIPKNIYQFFYIRVSLKESHRCYWAQQEDIWDKFTKFQSHFKLNQVQKKIIDTIALMSNTITYKEAEKELKNQKSDIFKDIDLFHVVLMMITFYQFSAQAKNKIFTQFENIFTYQTINQIIEHPIYQQLQCQEPLII